MTARKRSSNEDFNGLKATGLGAPTAASTDAARIVDVETASTADRSRANHTGSQLASTVSDFDAQVRSSRLDQMTAATAPITIVDAVNPTHAVTKQQLDAATGALTSGMTLKGAVRVASTVNVTIASPGATVDGVTMSAGQLFIAGAQTTGSQDGVYVWNGAATPATRALNWDTAGEAVAGSYWIVTEGTNADKFAVLTTDTAVTPGTTDLTFAYIGATAGVTDRYEQALGNGAATTFTLTHNLNTRAVLVSVRRNASPWDEIDVYNKATDVNTIVIEPDLVWTSNEFYAVVKK